MPSKVTINVDGTSITFKEIVWKFVRHAEQMKQLSGILAKQNVVNAIEREDVYQKKTSTL